MGLFGGFKAKFITKNSTRNDKSQNNIVVLKYKSFSEFDTPYHPGPPTNNIKENGVIHNSPRHKQIPIVNSATFEDSINNTANSIQKSLSLDNIVIESNSTPSVSTSRKEHVINSSIKPLIKTEPPKDTETPSSSYQIVLPNTPPIQKNEEHKIDDEIKIKNSRKKAPSVPIIPKDYRTTSVLDLQQNTSISKSSTPNDRQHYLDESEHQEKSTLIFMTQQKPVTESDAAISNDIYGTNEHLVYGYNSNDHDFKVNVVQHDINRSRSFSEDEISDVEEELTSFGAFGYSRQAESIFFGDDMMQPVITRPRRFIMMDDNEEEDDKSDDHHETDNEVDC